MAEITERRGFVATHERSRDSSYQAYKLLHLAFILAPTLAGLDKFFHVLVDWNQYLSPQVMNVLPISGSQFMMIVGVIEMAAGLLVALAPRIGAYVVALWMAGIIVNLLLLGSFFDVALRDFGLMLGALALARLSEGYSRRARRSTVTLER